MRKNKNEYTGNSERASGDLLCYFILHNMISVFYFFVITVYMGIYVGQELVLGYIFSREFLELTVFEIFPLSVISSVFGRITAFYGTKGYYKYMDRNRKVKRSMKRWSELNKGINRMGIKFLITALITSFFYSMGVITLLSYMVFDETSLLSLIVIYSVLKFGTFLFVRWLVGSKL